MMMKARYRTMIDRNMRTLKEIERDIKRCEEAVKQCLKYEYVLVTDDNDEVHGIAWWAGQLEVYRQERKTLIKDYFKYR